MSDLMNKWERKFGKYAIKNLTSYMIVMYIAGFVMQLVARDFLYRYLALDIYQILHGQVWRIVSWLFIPPGQLGIFTIFMLLLYYWLGNTLEKQWGAFKYNLFIFSGIFFTILGAFLIYIFTAVMWGNASSDMIFKELFSLSGNIEVNNAILSHLSDRQQELADFIVRQRSLLNSYEYNTYFINTSIFLAFASIFPDVKLYLYFILPIKIKWLAALDIALLVYSFIKGNLVSRVNIIASVLNVVIYILMSGKTGASKINNRRQQTRARNPYSKMMANNIKNQPLHKHKCFICGRTDLTNPELDFRFCSKCRGAYEYCNDHLFTHVHKQ